MDRNEFVLSTHTISEFIAKYVEELPQQNLSTSSTTTILNFDAQCPSEGDSFIQIFRDFMQTIEPGLDHQASPHNHADLPVGNSYASMISELLIAGINNVSLNWEASPAATELEAIVLNWLAKMMNLPKEFLHTPGNPGGGVLQNTRAESLLLSLLSARKSTTERLGTEERYTKLTIYISDLADELIDRLIMITHLRLQRLKPTYPCGSISKTTLAQAIQADLAAGYVPCCYISLMGTNPLCACDDLNELGPLCREHNVWLHVDGDHLGCALICPEMRHIASGMEYADSLSIGLHNGAMMTFDVVAYWIRNGALLTAALNVDPLYLRHKHVGMIHDYMNWQIGTGRKFKALKVWVVLKAYGVAGLQRVLREQIQLTSKMAEMLKQEDDKFEVPQTSPDLQWIIVYFRLKGTCADDDANDRTRKFLSNVNKRGKILLGSCEMDGKFYVKFIVNQNMRASDIDVAWREVNMINV